ncbi:NAD(P)/FAD-dependent oxidoreductase [Kitasatospora sp. NPDC048540]|uniref:NAD(P)/FAD-dependent oxidoreductase n=1 Tax=unclassified Kitasatospora TaxID=2633591 RepID=UPI00053BB85C|nr:NAD(P)/FAD-dependent oxidoreductase [Kitasatospora sp. MBT63]
MIDLLVVGGGPAGLATAIRAAGAGLRAVVAEPRPAPVDKACGEGLMPSAVGALDELGVRVSGHPLRGIRYLDATTGRGATAEFRGGPGLGVRRTALHTALAERAAELAVPVLPVQVREFQQGRFTVTAAGLTCRHLVAADGLHSPVRRALGLHRPPGPAAPPARYGLRRHYRLAPWSDLVEVHWSPQAEAYVTPLAPDLVGVALLTADRAPYQEQLARFPVLAGRLAGAAACTPVRGAGPLRQRVRARVHGRVLLVGDAAGYLDALTGEGVSVALASAQALVRCVAAGRPADYERAWRRASRSYRLLTGSLLWARQQPLLAQRIVPAAVRLPGLFRAGVNLLA